MDARVDPGAAPVLPGPVHEITVASWMTREDRDLMIGDNVAYVDRAIAAVAGRARMPRSTGSCSWGSPRVWRWRSARHLLGARKGGRRAGARRRRAARVAGRRRADLPEASCSPAARGTSGTPSARLDADEAALKARGATVETLTFDGAHEWHRRFRREGRGDSRVGPLGPRCLELERMAFPRLFDGVRLSELHLLFRHVGEPLVVFVDRFQVLFREILRRRSAGCWPPATAATSSFSLSWTAIESLF